MTLIVFLLLSTVTETIIVDLNGDLEAEVLDLELGEKFKPDMVDIDPEIYCRHEPINGEATVISFHVY